MAVAAPDEAGIPGETDADDDGDEEQSEPPEADSARRLPPPKAANSVPPARGAIVKALQGDLKLVIEGDSGIKVSVSFRDYPKARRTRISGSEARRDRAVAPALAATREDTREAVIETTQEGVYTFRVASEGGKGARANFILKIYEAGLRGRTANLGGRTISGSTVLLKILMPEAVLWDDDSAFTGSMEDSESETRYNATTGLYWKEYRD